VHLPVLPFPTLVAALACRAAATPQEVAFVFLPTGDEVGGQHTWAELHARACAVAETLRRTGSPGDRVLLAFGEGLPFLEAFFGCLYARRVAVPVHAPEAGGGRAATRVLAVAADAGVALVATTPDLAATLSAALPSIPVHAVGAEPATSAPPDEVDPGALAYLQYTSGSTGVPRGVRITHHHLAHQLADFDAGYGHQRGAVLVSWLPATHDLGLVYGRLMAVWTGMRCVFFPPAAFVQRPARWVRALSRHRATHSASPNFGFELTARRATDDELAGVDLSAVQVLVNGAEPIRPESEAAFTERFRRFGLRDGVLTHALGMSETTAKVTTEPPGRSPPRFVWLDRAAYERDEVVVVPAGTPGARPVASNGSPQFDTRVFAVEPARREKLGEDRVGELWVSGTTVADGYWNRPAETEETFRAFTTDGDGPFLRTGDLGFLRQGELYLSGRRKDVIIVRGQNHHPPDLERVLEAAHPALRPGGVVVIGVSADGAEGVGVVAEVHDGAVTTDVVRAVREALADQGLAPQTVALVPPRTLPKTTSGKHRRSEVSRLLLAGTLPLLARVDAAPETQAPQLAASPLRAAVLAAPPRRRVEVLERHLLQLVAARLGVEAADLDPDRPFKEHGLDSVAAVELVEAASRSLGVELPGTALFDHPTAAAMAAHLLGRLS
jgi:acyl-CoA synthetase (AMP-forming)/AMP-acid ligase II/acyl carrier protein